MSLKTSQIRSAVIELQREVRRGTPLMEALCLKLSKFLACDRVSIFYINTSSDLGALEESQLHQTHRVVSKGTALANYATQPVHAALFFDVVSGRVLESIPTCFVDDLERSSLMSAVRDELLKRSVKSCAIVPLISGDGVFGWIECFYTSSYKRFSRLESIFVEELAQAAGLILDVPQTNGLSERDRELIEASAFQHSKEMRDRFERLASHGKLIMLRTDANFQILEALGDSQGILGLSSEELCNDAKIWRSFLHPADLKKIWGRIRRSKGDHKELSLEVRVKNAKDGSTRWLFVKGVPLLDSNAQLDGWEGVGLDITDRRHVEEELRGERGRIEALYGVARSLQSAAEPQLVLNSGLKALISATQSDLGFAGLQDDGLSNLETLAQRGFSEEDTHSLARCLFNDSTVKDTLSAGEGVIIEDLRTSAPNVENREVLTILSNSGVRSVIFIPLTLEAGNIGLVILAARRELRYRQEDLDLAVAGARQVAVAARQAQLVSADKRQARSLAALYKLSHEVSKHLTAREVAEHAFPIIQGEVAAKRMWLGVLNEQGTHVVGQAGYGPGVRGAVVNVQVELDLRHDFFDEAIRTKQAVVVEAGKPMECSGLNRIVSKLELGNFVIIPLVSLSQVVGVMVVEPLVPQAVFSKRTLQLLSSMASEIATVILARRFESRMAEADKMRMAGLLASGIAHNFNNLLQAVMGQASLIEMQLAKDSPLVGSAKMIVAAATKGAALIKQLLSFSLHGEHAPSVLAMNEVLRDSREVYQSVLGQEIALELRLESEAPEVYVDFAQFQQLITNLLVNAKDAIGNKKNGLVRVTSKRVRLRSGEVDPELAPGAYLRIDIEDNGTGMDEERQARCFEPFFTTKNVDSGSGLGFGGFGLGLSSAYAVMKHHDGLITVRSKPGEGTMFSLYLPVTLARSLEEPLDGPPLTLEVLSCEVDEMLGRSIGVMLQGLGVRHRTVATLSDCESALADNSLRVVVLDNDNAGPDFQERVVALRNKHPNIKFLILSSRSLRSGFPLRLTHGVEYMVKPPTSWSLESTLKKLINPGPRQSKLKVELVNEREGSRPEQLVGSDNELAKPNITNGTSSNGKHLSSEVVGAGIVGLVK